MATISKLDSWQLTCEVRSTCCCRRCAVPSVPAGASWTSVPVSVTQIHGGCSCTLCTPPSTKGSTCLSLPQGTHEFLSFALLCEHETT